MILNKLQGNEVLILCSADRPTETLMELTSHPAIPSTPSKLFWLTLSRLGLWNDPQSICHHCYRCSSSSVPQQRASFAIQRETSTWRPYSENCQPLGVSMPGVACQSGISVQSAKAESPRWRELDQFTEWTAPSVKKSTYEKVDGWCQPEKNTWEVPEISPAGQLQRQTARANSGTRPRDRAFLGLRGH